jgi:hypothetical protein
MVISVPARDGGRFSSTSLWSATKGGSSRPACEAWQRAATEDRGREKGDEERRALLDLAHWGN